MGDTVELKERAKKLLDNTAKSCVYVPPSRAQPRVTRSEQGYSHSKRHFSTLDYCDYSLSPALLEKACEKAWRGCKRRIDKIVEEIYAPLADSVAATVHGAYDERHILPALPYPEIPAIALSGGTASLHASILDRLSTPPPGMSPAVCAHLHPNESTTLVAAMKSLVSGFVPSDGPHTKRPAASLATHDINLLSAWYTAQDDQPTLVGFLHDFEQFSQPVLQDLFEICSLHIPQVRLVFVLLLCGLSATSALQALPRATRALLRVESFAAPQRSAVVSQVISKTFFDPQCDTDIMIGPATFEYIIQHVQRYGGGVDFLMASLQLAYMKHFTQPLSILYRPSALKPEILSSPEAQRFALALYARLHPHPDQTSASDRASRDHSTNGVVPRAPVLLATVERARAAFHETARRLRHAVSLLVLVKAASRVDPNVDQPDPDEDPFATPRNGKGKAYAVSRGDQEVGIVQSSFEQMGMMLSALRGRASKEVGQMRDIILRLPSHRLRHLLSILRDSFAGLPEKDTKIEEAEDWLLDTLKRLPEDEADGEDVAEIADNLAEWLGNYAEERVVRLDECPLWDIWYTGATPFPSELINPAPRAVLVSALLYPHAFATVRQKQHMKAVNDGAHDENEEDDARIRALWELPDTNILYWRCAEAGRMVNVYDWFQAFVVVLEEQRRRLRRLQALPSTPVGTPIIGRTPSRNGRAVPSVNRTSTPSTNGDVTPSAKGKGKQRLLEDDDAEGDEDVDEDEEEWRIEAQARFIRALHELDYMGFIKPTGRKTDHVVRTTFDIPD